MPETTDGHILIVGGARSGKTAAVAIPTLMSWKERVFAIDIEGELYAKTKKARGEAQIKVFNPTDTTAYGYDPFYLLKNADDISSAARRRKRPVLDKGCTEYAYGLFNLFSRARREFFKHHEIH